METMTSAVHANQLPNETQTQCIHRMRDKDETMTHEVRDQVEAANAPAAPAPTGNPAPATTGNPPATAADPSAFDDMNVPALKQYAEDNSIDLDGATRREDILAALNA